jgi:hypothetical protein
VIQRKVLTPSDFTGLDQIRGRLAAFETRYNAIARPFTWKFTRTDRGDLLRRIDAHDKNQPHDKTSPTPWQPDHYGPPTNLRARPLSWRETHYHAGRMMPAGGRVHSIIWTCLPGRRWRIRLA